jgi:Tfp pilus assembly protein PilP
MGTARSYAPSEAAIQVQKELLQPQFAYNPKALLDPFKPFIAPAAEAPPVVSTAGDEDLEAPPPEPQRPLTPLQRMRVSEIEAGLKAIMWGPLGRRAVIEDASGKGYIVSVGTPVGERNGVVSEIFNDHLVIQQEFWDKREKRMVPQNVMVKLKKAVK